MWSSLTMTLFESIIVSAMGFSIVFLVLIFLALVILATAKMMNAAESKKKLNEQPAPAPVAAVPEKDDSEIVSIVTAVICEELKVQPHELKINGIREV